MQKTIIALAMSVSVVLLPAAVLADTLILNNGQRVQGTVVGIAKSTLTFRHTDGVAHRYPTSQIDELRFVNNVANRREPAMRGFEVPAGTELVVRTVETIDSRQAGVNQTFAALLERAVTDGAGTVIIPERSSAQLVLTHLTQGEGDDVSEMMLDIRSITVNGKRYFVSTTDLERGNGTGIGKNRRTAEMVGGGAALGGLIGAIAGGGKGAAIGVLVGGAGGAGVQVLTKGHDVRVPSETVLTFKLDRPILLQPEW